MSRPCNKPTEELITMLRGSLPQQEEAVRCILQDGSLRQKAIGTIQKMGGSPQDAEEAFSESSKVFFMNILKGKYNGESAPETYFIGICINVWKGKQRSAYYQHTTFVEDALQLDGLASGNTGSALDQGKLTATLHSLLEKTGQQCKDILWNSALGHSMKEIAELLQLANERLAINYAYRCRERLRGIVKQTSGMDDFLKSFM
ncbi:MAG: sigma-70 family RNA polymerase sigma factor [Saprospiraceae bacterium]|nr:sigma-70 family RNA polymerase sigma factor [Saprospiraceae bacterium]